MKVFRIASKAYINDLSGRGAMMFCGRWNKKGVSMLYTSQSVSLAALETLANLSINKLNDSLFVAEIELSDTLKISDVEDLPKQWNVHPHTSSTVSIGSDFVKSGGFCLKVPSAIIPKEYNYLFNPGHEDFGAVKIIDTMPLILDNRLVRYKASF